MQQFRSQIMKESLQKSTLLDGFQSMIAAKCSYHAQPKMTSLRILPRELAAFALTEDLSSRYEKEIDHLIKKKAKQQRSTMHARI